MIIRKAEAEWKGGLSKGTGTVKLGSGLFGEAYSFSSSFENGTGTNPEELIGAALAGCFSMALSAILEQSGFPPEKINTEARVSIDKDEHGFSITTVELETEGRIPGIDEKTYLEKAEAAKMGCPVAKALSGARITMKAKLAQIR